MHSFMNHIAVTGAMLIMAGTASAQEKDKPLLWSPRYLGSGEIALPERVVQSDLVVSGKITTLEPKDVEATFSAELPNKVDYRIAVVKVHEVVHGQKTVKELRLGFIAPGQDRKVDKAGKALPIPPFSFQRFTKGQNGLFFLRKHYQGDFYMSFVFFGAFVDSRDGAEFTKNLHDVRRLNKVLEAPVEALKDRNATNRFVAATMLVHRHRLSWLKERKGAEKTIDAEVSKLLLKTLAEADWQENEAIDKYPPHPYRVFLELGVKKADGYDPPANPSDDRDTLRYTHTWLRDHQEKYRIKCFTDAK